MILIPKPGKLLSDFFKKKRMAKTNWNSNKVRAVLNHYELGSWRICEDLGGGNSDNLLLQTSKGFKILKRYYWSIASTIQEHSILKHLTKNKFISPHLEVNKDGSTYTFINNSHYAIYDYVKGYNFKEFFLLSNTKQTLVTQAATMLAHFHRLMLNFVPEGRKLNGYMPDGKRLFRDVRWHLNVLDKYVKGIKKKNEINNQEKLVLNIRNKIRRGLIETGKYFDMPDTKFSRLVNHGDYSPKNVLFIRKKIITILDFGDANLNLRAMDVARGLSSFSMNRKFGIDERLSHIFLKSYCSQLPLSHYELEAIPDLLKWRYLMNIIWKLFHITEDSLNPKKTADYLTFIRDKWEGVLWITRHASELRIEFKNLMQKY